MLQDTDNTAALSVSANPRADEAKEVSAASFSTLVIDFFDGRDQKPASHSLPEKVNFARRLRDLWQDLQDNSHWKYEQLSPVQLLEKEKLQKKNSRDIDELARADWFWSRRPRLLPAVSSIVWLVVVLGLPFWLFSIPAIGVPLLIIAVVIVDTEIVRSVRWRRQYESSIGRLIRTSKNDRGSFGVTGVK